MVTGLAALDDLTSTTGVFALVAVGLAAIALVLGIVLALRLRHLRADQRVVLGERDARDLVAQGADVERHVRELHDRMEEVAVALEGRVGMAETRLDGAIAYRGLVRYDAYNEMSGQQSTTIALLDTRRSGIVVSSIHHRDQARVYAKQIVGGQAELQLSPEEEEAVSIALRGARA